MFVCIGKSLTFALANLPSEISGPDGGIGRRAGLKHQWGNPCRFDPGSGYRKEEEKSSSFFVYNNGRSTSSHCGHYFVC